jgi:hypothetical protein
MSCANIGISQLDALQLRNLVGPTGIGNVTYNNTGRITQRILLSAGFGTYVSPFKVPSGTGIIKFRIETLVVGKSNSQIVSLDFVIGQTPQLILPYGLPLNQTIYEGIMLYNNPSPTPATISVNMRLVNSSSVTLQYFEADTLSFGPYVDQGH